ncbi:hypothetical protein GCM10023152_13020 [Agromyces bauzanensis]|uniref:Uncharacterized protein n=2 Tax=Agromyces bauzanensis TaxID=1308924 RepID=A0A917PW36_9MICO|nr:hypothetical protein GCM10011372_35790 [Agromyces bauzanensis]
MPASVVLENVIADIPDRASRGMFDFNRPEVLVARVVLQLMLKLELESSGAVGVRSSLDPFGLAQTHLGVVGEVHDVRAAISV